MKYITYILGLLVLVTGCSREDSVTYQVAKEPASVVAPSQTMGTPSDNQAVEAAHAAMAAQSPAGLGFTSELPTGWTEVPGTGMRKVSYTIEGTSIDFYLISLAMGDVPSNVNRWRAQVSLAPASNEQIAEDLVTFEIASHAVNYIDIFNNETGEGISAAIVDLAPQYWYFKAKGPVAELTAHAAEIRAYLESIKFEGHNH